MLGRNLHAGMALIENGETLNIISITEPDRDGFRRAQLSKYLASAHAADPELFADELKPRLIHVRERVANAGDQRRKDIALGLRQLANEIERNEAIPISAHTRFSETLFSGLKSKGEAAAYVRSMKPVDKDYLGNSLYITKEYGNGAVSFAVTVGREEVCKKVEREVTKTVIERDAEAVKAATEAIPEREVTKTVTEVEWECEPLLAASK